MNSAARRPIDMRASLAGLAEGRLPIRATERLAEEAGPNRRLFSSDLSVNEYLLARDVGCEPIAQVMGTSIFHIGQIPDYKGRTAELTVISDFYTPADAELIPTGEIRDVAGTPLDFRTPTAIGARIDQPNDQLQYGGGYDLNYALADAPRAAPALAATLSAGGLVMTMLTTEPGLQFYSGNFLSGIPFARRSAVCLQGQHYTDSLNHPAFPTTVLRPGERFASRTLYRFSAG